MRVKYLHLGLQLIQINCGITVHCELLWQFPMIAPNASMDAQVNVTHPGSKAATSAKGEDDKQQWKFPKISTIKSSRAWPLSIGGKVLTKELDKSNYFNCHPFAFLHVVIKRTNP